MSLATRKYDNILIIGGLNINTSNKKQYNESHLSNICDTFSFKQLIADITCVKSTNGTSIDVFLTNKSKCFHHTASFETTVSNCYKLNLYWRTSSVWCLYKHFQNSSTANEPPFMTKELIWAIMSRSKLKNRHTKWWPQESFLEFKKQRNICKNLNKKTKNNYFSKIT